MDSSAAGEPIPFASLASARPIVLLINGHARRGRQLFEQSCHAVREAGIPLGEAILTRSAEETQRVLRCEVENGARTVIAGGGDGTLSLCANTLAHTPVALGVLPLGTGNTLARSLNIPLDLRAAARTIAGGCVEAIDVGRVNERVFVNSVSLGLSAQVAGALDRETKQRLGLMAWPLVGLRVWLRHRALVLRLILPDQTLHVRTHQLLVSNGRYVAGPIKASPQASVQDGYLRVFVLGGSRHSSLMRATWEWLTGRRLHSARSRYFAVQAIKVEGVRRRALADVDGEVNESTPLVLSIEPRALRVIVPQGFRAADA